MGTGITGSSFNNEIFNNKISIDEKLYQSRKGDMIKHVEAFYHTKVKN